MLDINYVIFPLTSRVQKTMNLFDDSGLDFSKQ